MDERASDWQVQVNIFKDPQVYIRKASLRALASADLHMCARFKTHGHTGLHFLLFLSQLLLSVFIVCSICLQYLPCLMEGVYIILCVALCVQSITQTIVVCLACMHVCGGTVVIWAGGGLPVLLH